MVTTGTDSTGIDTTYYASFPDALKKINKLPQASMVLLGDVGFEGKAKSQAIKTNLTIDLNGYTLGDMLSGTSLLSLGVDTLMLHITSSRPGGRIAVTRAYNGRIYAISCSKGKLILDHITVDARNTAIYDEDTCKSVAVTAVSIGNIASAQISDCSIYASADGNATAIGGSGNANTSAQLEIQSCVLHAEGRQRVYGVNGYGSLSVADCAIDVNASGNPAYGLYVNNRHDSVLMQDVRGIIMNTRVRVSALKQAYGIYATAPLTITNDSIRTTTEEESAYALYTNRNSALFVLSRSLFIAEAGGTTANGAHLNKGDIEAENCLFRGTSRQGAASAIVAAKSCRLSVRECDLAAKSTEKAQGINCYNSSYISDCKIDVSSSGNPGYGIYIYNLNDSMLPSYKEAEVHRTRITVSAFKQAYGIYTRANTILTDNTVSAKTEDESATGLFILNNPLVCHASRCSFLAESAVKAYAIKGMTAGTLDSCTLTAKATQSEVYALHIGTSEDSIRVDDCRLLSDAPEKNNFINKNANMEGRLLFRNGYYSHDTNLRMYLPEGYGVYRLFDGEPYRSGYRYTVQPIANPDAVVARMYNTRTGAHIADYKRVADALWYAMFHNENELTIVVIADCQLDWSTYIVPKHTTLVVGYTEDQKAAIGTKALRSDTYSRKRFCFARLELLDDAELIVEGVLEVSGVQQTGGSLCGTVSGAFGYGQIHLAPTASIVIAKDARLQAWGYITGSGIITAKAGAAVYEFLQLGGWKGGTVTYTMFNNKYKVFPFTHFFYQNIESPVVYHAGSKAFGSTMISVSSYTSVHDDIRLLGDTDAMFVFAGTNGSDATVRKEYDPLTDRIIWTTNGDIALDQLGLYLDFGMGQYDLLSSQYVLPLNTNMTIRAHSGTLDIRHDVLMPPGAQVEIGPEAGMHIPENANLYLYDTDQWGFYGSNHKGYDTVSYSPSWEVCPRDSMLVDARIEMSGTAVVDGALYTTESGAAIVGTDSVEGKIIFTHGAAPNGVVYQLTGTYDSHQYTPSVASMPALLNADESRTRTKDAKEGAVYTYAHGLWFDPEMEDVISPQEKRTGRLILENGTVYIVTPDGRRYTLLGLPG